MDKLIPRTITDIQSLVSRLIPMLSKDFYMRKEILSFPPQAIAWKFYFPKARVWLPSQVSNQYALDIVPYVDAVIPRGYITVGTISYAKVSVMFQIFFKTFLPLPVISHELDCDITAPVMVPEKIRQQKTCMPDFISSLFMLTQGQELKDYMYGPMQSRLFTLTETNEIKFEGLERK
jgi:hypothetical protein